MKKRAHGFTVVELLIVIVVVAILAAISIVAYNGIQQRARNAATVSAAKNALTLITLVHKLKGQISITDLPAGSAGMCIGPVSNFPKIPELKEGECFPKHFASLQLEAALKDVGTLRQSTYAFDIGSGSYTRGVQYSTQSRHINNNALLWYDLIGQDQDCKIAGSVAESNGTQETDCYIDLTELLGETPIVYK